MNLQVNNSDNVLEEIKDLIVEGETAARGLLISTYLRVGTMILENNLDVQLVAQYLERSKRSIQYMVAFARKPEIADKLGKHEGWKDVIQKYLTTPKEEIHQHNFKLRCSCGAINENKIG